MNVSTYAHYFIYAYYMLGNTVTSVQLATGDKSKSSLLLSGYTEPIEKHRKEMHFYAA